MNELAQKLVDATEKFLNDRRGFNVDALDDDIRQEFLDSLKEDFLAVLRKEKNIK